MSKMVDETCTNGECEDFGKTHPFPPPGARIRVLEDVETREPGHDEPIMVRAGEEGVVIGYVVEWHDVHVALTTQDGQDVWIDCDNLELIATPSNNRRL